MYNLEGLLRDTTVRKRLGEAALEWQGRGMLRSIKIKLLSTCNLRCEMCTYWRMPKQALPPQVVLAVLESAAALGCAKVHFSGGEVMLYRDLPLLITQATRLGMRASLTSNGVLMHKERARSWLQAGLRAASFSLDGASAKTHDAVRGVPGAFKRTVKGIRLLQHEATKRGAKLSVRINCVLMQHNLAELPALLRLAGDLGAVDVVPMPIDGNRVARPNATEIAWFNHTIVPEVMALRRTYGMPLAAARLYPFGRTPEEIRLAVRGHYAFGYYDAHPCYAPYLHAFISHTGDVFACCMTRHKMPSLGNVQHQSLATIFQSSPYEALRRRMQQQRLRVCAHCDMFLRDNRLVRDCLEAPQFAPPVPSALEGVA